MTHEIELEGYYPKILGSPMRMLCLGTKASYGMEVLHFQRGTGWDGLALDVTFTPDPQAEGTTVLADAGDTVAVPPAATAQATNSGSVTVRGVRDGVQCISCNIPYLVLNHAPVPGQQTDPAESVWKQYADKLIPAGGQYRAGAGQGVRAGYGPVLGRRHHHPNRNHTPHADQRGPQQKESHCIVCG